MEETTISQSVVSILIDPPKPFIYDMRKEGWELKSDIDYKAGEVMLKLIEFLGPGESFLKGTIIVERAKKLSAYLGQKHAEALLENQHLIPMEWRSYYLIFPGTVWLGSDGNLSVPYLELAWRTMASKLRLARALLGFPRSSLASLQITSIFGFLESGPR